VDVRDSPISFDHDDVTEELCPEAQGHFCMLWGEHGHGGYDSQIRGYIQGGQPMDEHFELIGIYLDFEDARTAGDWPRMRLAIAELRQLRVEMNISQAEEREIRGQQEEV
jgi:hypothetical protein